MTRINTITHYVEIALISTISLVALAGIVRILVLAF